MTLATETSSPAARRRHWEMLSISAIAIVLSFALFVRSDGRVALRAIPRFPVPETCLAHAVFGVDCPACGLTRSFIELARGHWTASLNYHRLGWMMALAVVLQLPYRSACLLSDRTPRGVGPSVFGGVLIAALLLNWVVAIRLHS